MDKKLIDQYGEDILSYRLRTARQKKRAQYEDFDKQLLRLDREEGALHTKKRQLGWEPLKPPIQKGYVRFFVLREDVSVSKHAAFYAGILQKINTYDYSHRKDFKVKKRKGSRFKKYVVKGQRLLEPCSWHLSRLGLTDAEKQQFREVVEYHKQKGWTRRYVFNEPWRFVLRVKPNMIDKVRKRDTTIDARLAEISDYMDWNVHRLRLLRLKYGNQWWNQYKSKTYVNEYKNKSLSQIMDMIRET